MVKKHLGLSLVMSDESAEKHVKVRYIVYTKFFEKTCSGKYIVT
jgi:hypothetical protein